jgi:hypothetical protein
MGRASTRLAAAVRADHEDRGGIREDRALLRRELPKRAPREAVVRIVDPAREGEEAQRAPDDHEEDEAGEAEADPQAPAALARGLRASRLRRRSGAAGPSLQGDLPLRAAASIERVRLVSDGHLLRHDAWARLGHW